MFSGSHMLAHYTICRSTNIHNIEGCPGERHGWSTRECWEPHCLRRGKREGFFACPNPNDLYPLCGATPTTACVDPPRCGRVGSKCLHQW